MIENEEQHDDDAQMENNTVSITKSSSMKHGWCQTIDKIVHYYQTPFNITLILEQL